jgi:hypothetical protein
VGLGGKGGRDGIDSGLLRHAVLLKGLLLFVSAGNIPQPTAKSSYHGTAAGGGQPLLPVRGEKMAFPLEILGGANILLTNSIVE